MQSLPTDSVLADTDSYEYEYHPSETEVIYVNLDLSSQSGVTHLPHDRPARAVDIPVNEDEVAIESTEAERSLSQHVQILDLHTYNPIVSYQNQIFSCTWADQIGTELFFAAPDLETDSITAGQEPPLRRGKGFDLVAANSVKLLGRKATLAPSGRAVSTRESTTCKKEFSTSQSRFLERLMDIKRTRGETDQVRTAYSIRREPSATDRLSSWARTEEQLKEIERLKNAASQGDADAMAALDELYARTGLGASYDNVSDTSDHNDHDWQT